MFLDDNKQVARMVRVHFNCTSLDKLINKGYNLLQKIYENYGTRKLDIGDNSFWSEIPSDVSYENWKKMCEDNSINEYLKENFIYNGFDHIFNLDDYNDFDFFEYNSGLYSVKERFEVKYKPIKIESDVDRALALINTNINLFDKQMEQLNKIGVQHYNEKCNSPVVDNFLSSVNQVLLLEDACSDFLQSKLAEGWRIISVTPQPNQRRPDYVLGMAVEKPTDSAYRC